MKVIKVTPKFRRRIREVARMRYETPSDMELSIEGGVSRLYVAQLISQEMRRLKDMTFHVEPSDEKIRA